MRHGDLCEDVPRMGEAADDVIRIGSDSAPS
jgi:hypothetical protein